MTPLAFEPIDLARQDAYRARLAATPQIASDYSFVNLWAWADEYGLSWAWDDPLVWIRQEAPESCFWAPVGNWDAVDWPARLAALPGDSRVIRVPKRLAELWRHALGPRIALSDSRDHWDYLYDPMELIELKGNKFHKKKNLLNQFCTQYRFEYVPVTRDLIGRVLLMQLDWCAWRNCEASAGLAAEDRVIRKVLTAYDHFPGMAGGALLVEHQVIAFTVGEALPGGMLVIHFEKGLESFKGVYQAINQRFLDANRGFDVVNREQDLGNEGLRKAKLAYNPVGFVVKQEARLEKG